MSAVGRHAQITKPVVLPIPSTDQEVEQVNNSYDQMNNKRVTDLTEGKPPRNTTDKKDLRHLVNAYEELVQETRRQQKEVVKEYQTRLAKFQSAIQKLQERAQSSGGKIDVQTVVDIKEQDLRATIEEKDTQCRQLLEKNRRQRQLNVALREVVNQSKVLLTSDIQLEKDRMEVSLRRTERLLQQAEAVAEVRQAQYVKMLAELTSKEHILEQIRTTYPDLRIPAGEQRGSQQLSYLEGQVVLMRKQIDQITFERDDLSAMLLHKERALSAVQSVKEDMPESTAIQLSMSAILMAQSGMDLRYKLKRAEQEVSTLQSDLEDSRQQESHLQTQLLEKRKENAGLIEAISARDMEMTRLETLVAAAKTEIRTIRDEARIQKEQAQDKARQMENELRIAEENNKLLRSEITSRDSTVLALNGEIFRLSHLLSSGEKTILELRDTAEEAHRRAAKIQQDADTKVTYLLEVERQMKKADAERQSRYQAELTRSRQLQLEMRCREEDARSVASQKAQENVLLREAVQNKHMHIQSVKAIVEKEFASEEISQNAVKRMALKEDLRSPASPPRSPALGPGTPEEVQEPAAEGHPRGGHVSREHAVLKIPSESTRAPHTSLPTSSPVPVLEEPAGWSSRTSALQGEPGRPPAASNDPSQATDPLFVFNRFLHDTSQEFQNLIRTTRYLWATVPMGAEPSVNQDARSTDKVNSRPMAMDVPRGAAAPSPPPVGR